MNAIRTLWRIPIPVILVAALGLRAGYSLSLYWTLGDDGLIGLDSIDYLRFSREFATAMSNGAVSGWQLLGSNLHMMPLFTWLLATCFAVGGGAGPLLYVIIQGGLDTATCLIVYHIAGLFDRRFAIPAIVAAAVNPTQIVLAGLVYSDTPFVFFAALSLLASLRWLKSQSLANAVLLGVGLGAAALFRILIVPWAGLSIVFLGLATLRQDRSQLRRVARLAVPALIVALCIGPIMARNYSQYGAFALTPQGGMHLTRWVVPLVKEADDGTPWHQTYLQLEKLTEERFGPLSGNPFENSRRYVEIGNEAMLELGLRPALKAWSYGAAINFAAPALLISPPVAQLPHTGFFSTPGRDMPEKVFNFVFRSDNARYAKLLLIGLAAVFLVRLIQLAGVIFVLQTRNFAALFFCAAWIAYVLLINGPVASPKYRLPLEPLFDVLTGAGIAAIIGRKRLSPPGTPGSVNYSTG